MIHSTLGFIYTPDFDEVLLITKHAPALHAGKLNGLGGKCDPGESAWACIVREVEEECGLQIPSPAWLEMGSMSWNEWQVEILATVLKEKRGAKTLTADQVAWYPTKELPENVLTNLRWLVPLGIDALTNSSPPKVEVRYPGE